MESVVAVVVFAVIGGAVLAGTSTARGTASTVEGQSIGEGVARNQMEQSFNQPYRPPQGPSYPTITPPQGYSVSVVQDEYINGAVDIEKVIVTVRRHGRIVQVLQTLRASSE